MALGIHGSYRILLKLFSHLPIELTPVNAVCSWSLLHDQAFKETKYVIANAMTLTYVDGF